MNKFTNMLLAGCALRWVPGTWTLKIECVPQDMWIGVYWRNKFIDALDCEDGLAGQCERHVYVCIVPIFPIHFRMIWACIDDPQYRGKPIGKPVRGSLQNPAKSKAER